MSTELNALTITSKEMLIPSKLAEIVKNSQITTPRKSIESNMMSLSTSVKQFGYKDTAAAIVLQISRLELLLNVSKQMQAEAIAETAKMAIDHCLEAGVCINLADVDIIFKRAAKGEYGKFYGGFGCADVLSWFNLYTNEKAQAYVDYNIEKSSKYKFKSERAATTARARELIEHKRAHAQYLTEKLERNGEKG